jgi:hypothetical protein
MEPNTKFGEKRKKKVVSTEIPYSSSIDKDATEKHSIRNVHRHIFYGLDLLGIA